MSGESDHPLLMQRGLFLIQQDRYSEAAVCFRELLSGNPRNSLALFNLALCQYHLPNEKKQSLESIDQALQCDPENSTFHSLRGLILLDRNQVSDAEKSVETALKIDPHSVFAFTTKARIHWARNEWPQVEEYSRKALELDADNAGAANLLSVALRFQKKSDENKAQVRGMLARDPEDPDTHVSAGWSALHEGNHQEAENHFREALRLHPNHEGAREGLLEAFKSRSPIYRKYLAYCLWMTGFTQKSQWILVIGFLVFYKVVVNVLKKFSPVLAHTVVALYLLFVLWLHVAKPVGNLMLLADRFARLVLRFSERLEAMVVGGSTLLGLGLLIVGNLAKSDACFFLAVGFLSMSFPLASVFTNHSRVGRILFSILALPSMSGLLLYTIGLISGSSRFLKPSVGLLMFGILLAGVTTWLTNIRSLNR